ncbi:MAG TPA: hypothetical protein PLA83_04310 [Deltaproteobacteria bacterium]|nr:hypothetical protein [Deltaproteobacteria bacterium]
MISPKRIVAIILSMLMLSLVACGSSDDDPVSTTTTTTFDSEDLFYATMRETTPVYDPISAEGEQEGLFGLLPEGLIEGESPAWGNEVLLYKVYFTLRDFRSPRDEGVVDRSNLYKLLYDAESVFTDGYEFAEALATPRTIASPFAGIDTSATVFTHAVNSIEESEDDEGADDEAAGDETTSLAYKVTGDVIEVLVSWKWSEEALPNKAERGIAYYVYDKTTQDITIDMVYSVDYDISSPESTYNLRCKASGNIADHSFNFNYIINDTKIIAKGVSQGDGNYVIFKYTTGLETKYLKVPVGEGEQFFKDVFEGIEPVPDEIDDPNGYLEWIDAQTFMDEDDLLTSTEQLNVGVEGIAGTINLDF